MKNLNLRIKKNLKRTKICYIIAMIVFLIQFVLDLIIDFSKIISNRISINVVLIDFFDWIWWGTFILIIGSLSIGIFAEKTFSLPNTVIGDIDNIDKFKDGENYTFLPKNFIFNMTIELIFSSPFIISSLAVFNGQYGTYGIAIVPTIIGHIFFIIAYCQTRKIFSTISAINRKYSTKDKKQNVKTYKTNKLLGQTGKTFFIKYYNQLKKQNVVDIMDIIQENHTEKTKKARIKSAKKIFSNNLQMEALNIILKNEDESVNKEIVNSCKYILEVEDREARTQILEKSNLKNNNLKKSDIVPDCSFCKYRINDMTCEIWRKKPTGACEEFKKDKNFLNFKI